MRVAGYGAVVVALGAIAIWMSGCGPSCAVQQGGCKTHSLHAQDPTAGDDVVCFNEVGTGSHIAEPRCYRRSEIDDRRESDRARLEKAQMNSNRPRHSKRGDF